MEDTFALKFWVGWFAGVGDLNKYTKWVQHVDFQVEPNKRSLWCGSVEQLDFTLCEKPLIRTLFLDSSHMSQELSFHT